MANFVYILSISSLYNKKKMGSLSEKKKNDEYR